MVGLNVDKERGCLGWTHVLTIVDNNRKKSMMPPPKWIAGKGG